MFLSSEALLEHRMLWFFNTHSAVCPPTHLPTHTLAHPSLPRFTLFPFLPPSLSHPSIYPFIHPPIYLPITQSIHPQSIHKSIHPPIQPTIQVMSPELWLCQTLGSRNRKDELTQSLPSRSSQPGQGPDGETGK